MNMVRLKARVKVGDLTIGAMAILSAACTYTTKKDAAGKEMA